MPIGKLLRSHSIVVQELARILLYRKIWVSAYNAVAISISEAVAQLVEQQTFNLWVLGSIPSGLIDHGKAFSLRKSTELELKLQ